MKHFSLIILFSLIVSSVQAQNYVTTIIDETSRRVEFRFDQFDDFGNIIVGDDTDEKASKYNEFRIYFRGGEYEVVKLNDRTLAFSKKLKSPDGGYLYLKAYKIGFRRSLIKNNIEKVSIYYNGKLKASTIEIGKRL